ncbi:hypothetical protein ISF26_24520 (plasmid) [Gloeobacter morelensis MG652769]|nr:hypothetical protein ISF26_24520 [Gloeobacter morelensis MG652769]
MHEASGRSIEPAPSPAANRPAESSPTASAPVPPSRVGKKAITGHFDPAVSRQLKQLALDRQTSVQALMAEALNDLFEKHGRSPLA